MAIGDCFRRKKSSDPDGDLDPVLLISGIAGSILNSRDKRTGFEMRVWVRIFLANLEFKKRAWSLYNAKTVINTRWLQDHSLGEELLLQRWQKSSKDYESAIEAFQKALTKHWNPDTLKKLGDAVKAKKDLKQQEYFDPKLTDEEREKGYTESLDKNCEVVVPEDDYGLYAIDILDPSLWMKCMHVKDVYQFHDMIDMLVGCGYNKGTTLFGYGYDFRQSNRIDKAMDGLKVKLTTAYKVSGGRKVNLITHSMGGLIVMCFMSLYKEVFAKYVNKWISIACPFQGAPGCINDALLTGLEFVNGLPSYFFVSRWAMHQLVVECPSVYEMLPNPNFKWKKQPEIHVWRKQTQDKKDSTILESYGPTENAVLFEEALRDNELHYGNNSIPLPFNFAILKWANETRRIIDSAKLPDGVSFYNIFGTSFDTPFDVSYGSKTSPIEQIPQICHSEPKYSYVDGDGTVPSESAMADGLPATARVGVRGSHRSLLSNKSVFKLVQQWLGVGDKQSHHPKTSRVIDEGLKKHISISGLVESV